MRFTGPRGCAAGFALLVLALTFAPAPKTHAAPAGRGVDPVVGDAMASLSTAERADRLQAVRALRRYVYRRLPLASTEGAWITDPPVRDAPTLGSAMALFAPAVKGVWCQAAAIMLARLYRAAGYRAWVTSYGDPSSLTHTVTLVEVGGRIYLQDAYFNLDYLTGDGRPLPYFDLLGALSRGAAPRVRQDIDFRLGIFDDPRVARVWTPPGLHGDIVCTPSPPRYLCDVAMTEARFAEVYYRRDAVRAFLRGHGQDQNLAFLMMFPLWTQGPAAPDADSAAIQGRIEAITAGHPT